MLLILIGLGLGFRSDLYIVFVRPFVGRMHYR
jgi:hypothetical protein